MSDLDAYLKNFDDAFAHLKRLAETAAEEHNSKLPSSCPQCSEPNYIEGLRCMTCDYQAPIHRAWRVVEPDEFGFALVALGKRSHRFQTFHLDPEM